MQQDFQIRQLSVLKESTTADKTSFISQRARGAYICSLSRPDLASVFAILAQAQDPTVENVRDLNILIRQA